MKKSTNADSIARRKELFGHLIPQYSCDDHKHVHCYCQCGNEVDVLADDLLEKRVTKCSDDCTADLTGKKFGKLSVISRGDIGFYDGNCGFNGIKGFPAFTDKYGNIIATNEYDEGEEELGLVWDSCYKLTQEYAVWQNDGYEFVTEDEIVYALREIYGIVYPNYEWVCHCECGNKCIKTTKELLSGINLSCGNCPKTNDVKKKKTRKKKKPRTKAILKAEWSGIKQRCFNPNSTAYKSYGGRGITMYPEWVDDFQAFYDYLSQLENFEDQSYTLDRIDPNGNYEPANVRWADAKTQARNKRNTVFVDYYGEIIPIGEAAERCGIDAGVLYTRLRKNLKGDALFAPI